MKILKIIFLLPLSLLLLWASGFAFFSAFAIFAKPQFAKEKTDAIIVLTGGSQRIEEGLKLFAQRKSEELFISGVHKDVIKNDITFLWKSNTELPPCCITLGYRATTTEENAQEVKEWVAINNIKTIRLVTGNYHIARSLLEFYTAIPGIKIYAHPVSQTELTLESSHFWRLLFSEYNKILYRSLQLGFK